MQKGYAARGVLLEDVLAIQAADRYGLKYRTAFESSIVAVLRFLDIPIERQRSFDISIGSRALTYTPDIRLGIIHEDRRVVVETHGPRHFDLPTLERMSAFRESDAGAEHYLVRVTSKHPGQPDRLKGALKVHGYTVSDICDSLRYIRYSTSLHRPLSLKNEGGSVYAYFDALKRHDTSVSVVHGPAEASRLLRTAPLQE